VAEKPFLSYKPLNAISNICYSGYYINDSNTRWHYFFPQPKKLACAAIRKELKGIFDILNITGINII
jgi:hypothetical protein